MSYYAISPFLCAILALLLGIFTFTRNPKSPINRTLALLCYETFHWQACWFSIYYATTDIQRDFIVKFGFSLILFIPFTYYHFAARYLTLKKEIKWVRFFYSVGFIWLILLWTTNLFITGHQKFNWGSYAKGGPLLFLYLIFAAVPIIRILIILRRSTKEASLSTVTRNQNKFVYLSAWLYCFAIIEYIIDYGIPIYPIGVFFILASFSTIAFAIIKYNLMGIEETFKEWSARILSFLIIGGFGFTLILFCLKLFGFKFPILFVLLAMGTMSIIIPLIRKISALISQKIRPRPDFQTILKDYTEVDIMTKHTSKDLAELVVKRITDTLRPTVSSLMLLDKNTGFYNVVASSGKDEEIKTIAFKQSNHLISTLRNSHQTRLIVKDELNKVFSQEQADLIRRDLEILKSQISIPLILHGELFGILNLGAKASGQLYTPEEIAFLFVFANQSTFMMQFLDKIRAFHELEVKAEKLSGMTNLLVGFEHEINNQLIPVQTFFNLSLEKLTEQKIDLERLPRATQEALDNIQMILNSVHNYLEYSETKDISQTNIKERIKSDLFELKPKFAALDVKITTDIADNLPSIETYPTFYYLFGNIFTNSYYALKGRKTRLLDIKAYQTKDPQRPIEIVITDTGGDLLSRMDKEALSSGGDQTPERSTIGGINYFIAKHIVDDHQGELIVSTNPPPGPDEPPGTVFTIRLPLTQRRKE